LLSRSWVVTRPSSRTWWTDMEMNTL